MKWFLIQLIKLYRYFISPLLGQTCRYHPSCSNYAMEAIKTFPIWKSPFVVIWRLLRCHPFSKGGFDPVIRS